MKTPAKAARRSDPNNTEPTQAILRHWREAVPNDRLAHLIKDATRGLVRALTARLAQHKVSFGHWVFLRILWERDGMTQRELAAQAGLTEPTGVIAPKDPAAESIVAEINEKAGMTPVAQNEPLKPVMTELAPLPASGTVESPAPVEAIAPVEGAKPARKPRARRTPVAAAAAPVEPVASTPAAVPKARKPAAPRKPRTPKPRAEV